MAEKAKELSPEEKFWAAQTVRKFSGFRLFAFFNFVS